MNRPDSRAVGLKFPQAISVDHLALHAVLLTTLMD
jgi:hypothetical protein